MFPTGPLPSVRFSQTPSASPAPRIIGFVSRSDSDPVPSVSLSSGHPIHLPASYSAASPVSFVTRDAKASSFVPENARASLSQRQQPAHPTKPRRPEEVYPTPPPSPDLVDLETVSVLPEACDPVEPVNPGTLEQPYRPPIVSDHLHPASQATDYIPHVPAIPISLLLNTPHNLPHAAPFKLTQPAGILSVLGGNRVLQVDGASKIMDRMPYSAASTSGLLLTQDQGEEASVEALLSDSRPNPKSTPLSPDQSRVSSIFIHPPTPDREDSGHSLETLLTVEPNHSGSRSASPRTSPSGSPRVVGMRPSASAPPLPLHVLPEVRSPPRNTLEMANDSVRLAQQKRGRRPRLFGFTELPDSSGSSAASSRNASPERSPALAQELPGSASMGPASSAPGNFLPRRHQPVRAKSDTNLHAIRGSETSSPLATSSFVSRTASSSTLSPPERHTNGQIMMTSRRNTGLKLDFTGITPLNAPSADTPSAAIPSPYSAKLIRKKSGEILKPALKYGGPLAANGTPLEAPPPPDVQVSRARFESKSLPTTPSCPKYVHFDAQLERVKLFQKEQKPSVVSRSGSPTGGDYTTSEGEEYPFPSTDEEGVDKREKKVLQISLPNFPTHQAPDADLFLESLFLDDDRKSLRGIIQVRNMAFQKWVAVRFTFDWWQTTSEVTATHKDSVKGGAYDRFSFVIKLHDLLSKIEEKTLFLAIRYNTDGKEIWDSNHGHNYQVLFEKTYASSSRLVPKRNQPTIQPGMGKAVGGRTSQWSVTSGRDDDRLADLRAKLDRLQADDLCTSPPLLSPSSSRHNSFSPQRKPMSLDPSTGSPRRSVSAYDARLSNKGDLPAAGPALAARYDFSAALKSARRNSNSPKGVNADLPNVRTGLLQYGQNANLGQPSPDRGRPTMDFYSPRSEYAQLSPTEGFFSQAITGRSSQATNGRSSPPTPTAEVSSASSSRTATATSTPPAFITVPEVQVSGPSPEPSPNQDEAPSQPTSAAVSPPQLESSTESVNDDDTPSESPKSPPEATMPRWSPTDIKGDKVPNGFDSYASFIEQFCWGGASSNHTTAYLDRPSLERRAHSTSSLDAYFSSHGSPPVSTPGHMTPNGNRPMSGGYFSATSSQSPSSNGYYSAFSTPTRSEERIDEPASAKSSSASAMGLDFGALDMNISNRGHRSPPVLC